MEGIRAQQPGGAPASRELAARKRLPEWGDVGDLKKLFGFRESFAYELLRQGRIKTAMIRGRGNKRGKRLISLDSVRKLLEETAATEK